MCVKFRGLVITHKFLLSKRNMPHFVFVVFQTNRFDNQEKDSSEFGHCNLQNISLKMVEISNFLQNLGM